MTYDTLLDIGFLKESTFGTNAIAYGSPYYAFGDDIRGFENEFPTEKQEHTGDRKGDNRQFDKLRVVKSWVEGKRMFVPIHSYNYFFLLCNSGSGGVPNGVTKTGTVGNEIYTIDPIDSGETEPFSVRCESTGGSRVDSTKYHEWVDVGNRTRAISFAADHRNAMVDATETLTWDGVRRRFNADADYTDFTERQKPVKLDGSAIDGIRPTGEGYNPQKAGCEVTWDGVDITSKVRHYTNIWTKMQDMQHIQQQLYPQFVQSGDYMLNWTMEVLRDEDTSIFTDYVGQLSDTTKNMTYKIYNTTANYRKYLPNNNLIHVTMNYNYGAQEAVYKISGLSTSATMEIKDGSPLALWGF